MPATIKTVPGTVLNPPTPRTLKHQLSPSVGTNFECEYIATTWHPFDFPMTPKFVKTMRER